MNDPLKQKLDRHFEQRANASPGVAFEQVFDSKAARRTRNYRIHIGALALAASVALLMIRQDQFSPPALQEEFMAGVWWQAPTDKFLEYSTVRYYRELPVIYEETQDED